MTIVTPRDEDLFLGLDRTPLTLRQLLTLSETFRVPFPSYRLLHARLQRLLTAGWVRRFWYPTVGRQAESYYTLSPIGFALLHGHKAPLPARQHFGPVGDARCHHTKSLADVLVHAQVAARRGRILFTDV